MSELPGAGYFPSSVRYSLDLDVGGTAPGHHLIVRGIYLHGDRLDLEYAFKPGLSEAEYEDRTVFLNVEYGADVAPADGSVTGSWGPFEGGPSTQGEIEYARPPVGARFAWFDFFRTDYVSEQSYESSGMNNEHYRRSRVCRLSVELATGCFSVER